MIQLDLQDDFHMGYRIFWGTILNLRSLFAITSASTRKGRHCGFAIGYPEKFTLDYQFAPIFLTKPIPPTGNTQKTHTTHVRVQGSTILHKILINPPFGDGLQDPIIHGDDLGIVYDWVYHMIFFLGLMKLVYIFGDVP